MIAKQAKLAELLEGTKQFEVPLYQRPYSWGTPDREQFWADILRAGRDPKPGMHFTGSVVFMERTGDMAGNLKRARLIDGQQRLTTLTLLMLALSERLTEQGELELPLEGTTDTQRVMASDIRDEYLLNKRLSGDSRYKLLPTHVDRDTLRHLLGDAPAPQKGSREIQAGVLFFRQKLALPNIDLREVLRGVNKLQVVTVALEEGRDDPQLIFESLNSTGKDLAQADLVRNNVLMGLTPEQQDDLSRDFWVPMEARFADTEEGTFDRFMRDFLTLRTRSIPNKDEVYTAFKAYRAAQTEASPPGSTAVKALVADIAHMARLYLGVVHPESLTDEGVQLAMADLVALRVTVVSPFVLELLQDREKELLTDDETLMKALRLIESFLIRRAVTGERPSPLNRLFASLGRDLRKDDYLRSLAQALVRFQDRDQDGFPSNEAFSRSLQTTALYRLQVCKPLLVRLERGFNPKEKFEQGTLTIEHVMPQNDREDSLSVEWQQMLGPDWPEVQERLVHTLGNLTLTGYNSELGDRPFSEKKSLPEPKGYIHSRMLMTRELTELPDWNETRMTERAARLTERALKIWPFPDFTAEEISALRAEGRQRGKVKTVEDHLETSPPALQALFKQVRTLLLGLVDGVIESPQKTYIAYKVGSNFCDLLPQPALGSLKCWLNLPPVDLIDPHGMTKDVTGKGKLGNGNVELTLTPQTDLDAFKQLARQALDYQRTRQGGIISAIDRLASPANGVYAALKSRVLALSPGVSIKYNKAYLSFREQRAFCELEVQTKGLMIRVLAKEEEPLVGGAGRWEPTQWKGWWRILLKSEADLEAAWPAIEAAYESQHEAAVRAAMSNREGVSAFYAEVSGLARELSDGATFDDRKSYIYVKLAGVERPVARINPYTQGGVVQLLLDIPFGAVDDPTGRGEARTEQTPLSAGHFSVGLRPGETEAATSLLKQLFSHYGTARA